MEWKAVPMRILITGATGLIGRRLVLDRAHRGDHVVVITRNPDRAEMLFFPALQESLDIVHGDPVRPGPWTQLISRCDAVVNLAGASIAGRRWSNPYKHTLRHSRISSTILIARAIAESESPPQVFVNASAVGYYGETGEEIIAEGEHPGQDFLARLCVEWESEAMKVADKTRVVIPRFGVVLDARGGAIKQMLSPFKWYLGGPIGRGKQYMSWIHHHDLVELLNLALTREELAGPFNVVSPEPVRNLEFSIAFGRALSRPCWFPVPKFLLKMVMGEFAHYLTMSQRVVPARILENFEYSFRYPDVQMAFESLFNLEQDTV